MIRSGHFQTDPFAQGKLVRCVTGEIFYVAVDIRRGSPCYGRWLAATLTADDGNQFWTPDDVLHGFCTLDSDTVVASYYDRTFDNGVQGDDPDIGNDWPKLADPEQLSAKDRQQLRLRDLPRFFEYSRKVT